MPVDTEKPDLSADATDRMADLSQVIDAYNRVTENLQRSHDTLTAEVQRLQEQLASANAALERSRRLAALGEMAAGIAHEVRNPLASIHLYARMLDQDLADRAPQRDIARKIADAVRGLDAIVNDVLTYARPMNLRPHLAVVEPLLKRAVEAVRPMIDAAEVTVNFAIDDEDMIVTCDGELAHQALVNLIRNAAQAMEQVAGDRTLTVAAHREGAATVLSIADTGPGIDEQAIDRIFNPFFTTRATGTGLGLAIVHRLVDAHGGTIAVHTPASESSSGKRGAVFTLTFPDHEEATDE
jgi:signal transduction histidine kinase